jgi:hypothetical protein
MHDLLSVDYFDENKWASDYSLRQSIYYQKNISINISTNNKQILQWVYQQVTKLISYYCIKMFNSVLKIIYFEKVNKTVKNIRNNFNVLYNIMTNVSHSISK